MTKSKPVRRKTQRPTEIVQAALEVFAEEGFARATITQIAQRAGAAKGTVYLYFETKEQLFEAVVHEHIKPVFAAAEQIVGSFPGPASELLTRLLERIYQELANSPLRRGIMRILIGEGERFPRLTEFYHREIICSAQSLLRSVIQKGIDSGEFRRAGVLDFPATVMGPVMLAAIWKMTFDRFDPLRLDDFARAHIDLVLNGLRQRDM